VEEFSNVQRVLGLGPYEKDTGPQAYPRRYRAFGLPQGRQAFSLPHFNIAQQFIKAVKKSDGTGTWIEYNSIHNTEYKY
jgi:hypothetical protein